MATFETSAENAPLVFPLSPEQRQLLEEAAAIRGQSISDFALSNLLPLAQEAIEHGGPTRLSARDRDAFLQMLDAPPEPNVALNQAAERYRKHRD